MILWKYRARGVEWSASVTFWPRRGNEKLIGSTSVFPSFAVKRRLTIPLLGHTGSLALAHIEHTSHRFIRHADNVFATCAGAYGGNIWTIANVPRVICTCVHAYNARETRGDRRKGRTRPEHHSLNRNYPVNTLSASPAHVVTENKSSTVQYV